MAPIKSAIPQSLRSQLRPQSSSLTKSVSRGITVTSRNATPPNTTISKQPAPFRTPGKHFSAPAFATSCSFLLDFLYNSSHFPNQSVKNTLQQPAQQNPFASLLNAITHSLTTTTRPSLPHLHTLLRSYSSDLMHWSQYAHANPEKQYTRNLVCEVPGVFNLLLLVWTPGKKSLVHDHADAHCLMKVGRLASHLQGARWKRSDS